MTAELVERIHRAGSVAFDEFVDLALYGEGGFYDSGRGAGRRADFLTSPEVGPLFGAVIANALDEWWRELGEPDPYVVVEAGAGRGTLAASVLAAAPECAPALRYVLVERAGEQLRGSALVFEPPELALGPLAADDDDEAVRPVRGRGPVVTLLEDLPAESFTGVVLANELLDNLGFRLVERGPGGWLEVRVGASDDGFTEVLVPAADDVAEEADRWAPDAAVGSRLPIQHAATAWVRRALGLLDAGRVVVIDYADASPSLAGRPWTEWVRTYRSHGRGGHPLDRPGSQDITVEVAIDQLPDGARTSTQAEFLAAHGIDALADAARAAWVERAPIGDLEALKHRSRLSEAAALTDPAGLGAFAVLSWQR